MSALERQRPPPSLLVVGRGPAGPGARLRLRGPEQRRGALTAAQLQSLEATPTTVNDEGTVRFGDSLLILSHGTELPLLGDVTRSVEVADQCQQGAQRSQWNAHFLTTGKVMVSCARNSFMLVRADRRDEYAEALEVHYGQAVRICASSFLSDKILYLHLDDGRPLLLPRAHKHTQWRVLPAPAARAGAPPAQLGSIVRVNDHIVFQHLETGAYFMSKALLEDTVFGAECSVFAGGLEADLAPEGSAAERASFATWSLVNEAWVDAVRELEVARTGGMNWKEDLGDDFEEELRPDLPDPPALAPAMPCGDLEIESRRLATLPAGDVCQMILPTLKAEGLHGMRRLRRTCEQADVLGKGVLPLTAFVGILTARLIRLSYKSSQALLEAFQVDTMDGQEIDEVIDYRRFMQHLEGQMPEVRLDTVRRAYRKLRHWAGGEGGIVTIQDLMDAWKPASHPAVRAGELSHKEAFEEFLSQWEVVNAAGEVTAEEFLRYYRDVSTMIIEHEVFVQMVMEAWDL